MRNKSQAAAVSARSDICSRENTGDAGAEEESGSDAGTEEENGSNERNRKKEEKRTACSW